MSMLGTFKEQRKGYIPAISERAKGIYGSNERKKNRKFSFRKFIFCDKHVNSYAIPNINENVMMT